MKGKAQNVYHNSCWWKYQSQVYITQSEHSENSYFYYIFVRLFQLHTLLSVELVHCIDVSICNQEAILLLLVCAKCTSACFCSQEMQSADWSKAALTMKTVIFNNMPRQWDKMSHRYWNDRPQQCRGSFQVDSLRVSGAVCFSTCDQIAELRHIVEVSYGKQI